MWLPASIVKVLKDGSFKISWEQDGSLSDVLQRVELLSGCCTLTMVHGRARPWPKQHPFMLWPWATHGQSSIHACFGHGPAATQLHQHQCLPCTSTSACHAPHEALFAVPEAWLPVVHSAGWQRMKPSAKSWFCTMVAQGLQPID